MYNGFFGFKEKPFKLVPNPEFLFLGRSHEEALAHLTYAVSQGDGFVEITGEVGTGKTTLCRVFLETLDKNVEAAFIFNPKLDSAQLLKAIHIELAIPFTDEDPVSLTNSLNRFLLEKKALGKSVLLLIDEAQNLSRDTLEQIRLLSNLETTRSKLLQIILVGQPELCDILNAYDMRQLRQRINLSCHILPLTRKEAHDYVAHRVNVALRKPEAIFTRKAVDLIFNYSRGIPRLINIACDRSLLSAYSLNRKKVTPSIIRIAIRELDGPKDARAGYGPFFIKTAGIVFSLMVLSVFFLTLFKGLPSGWRTGSNSAGPAAAKLHISEKPPESTGPDIPAPPADIALLPPEPSQPEAVLPAPADEKGGSEKIPAPMNLAVGREDAIARILSQWDRQTPVQLDSFMKEIGSDAYFFKIAAEQHNLEILQMKGGPDLVRKFNLPAILGIASPGNNEKGYLAVVGISADNTYIVLSGNTHEKFGIGPEELTPLLNGDIYIIWKNVFGAGGTVSESSPPTSVVSVKLFLRQIGFDAIDATPVYDHAVKEAVKKIQAKHGLIEDGLVGPMTKIILLNEKAQNTIPYLTGYALNDSSKGN